MKTLVVIQARLGSTRLPKKVLLPLAGKPVLQHVVERAQRAGYPVVVACPHPDAIWDAVNGTATTPGFGWALCVPPNVCAENDVLARYNVVSEAYRFAGSPPDIVVRLTADCPALDHRLIQRAVQAIEAGHDYAGNTVERHWPRGLDVEAFTTELLLRTHQNATDPYDREHVTPWMQRHTQNPYALSKTAEDALGATNAHRWCLDTPDDYQWLQSAFATFPDPTTDQLLTLPPHSD